MEAKFYGTSPSSEIISVMAWVLSRFNIKNKVVLRVYSEHPQFGVAMTEGVTKKMKPQFGGHIEVRLYLSKGKAYPHFTKYVPGLPGIMVHSFVEEIVLVLAHEMRHAVQFDTGIWKNMTPYDMELDAECAGYSTLDVWRNNKRKSLDSQGRFTYPTL